MRIFVAGGTGAIGRFLVPQLLEKGHDVTAMVRDAGKARPLADAGAKVPVVDATNADALTRAIESARPDVVIHQLTALSRMESLKRFDQEFVLTNYFRTQVTDTMLAAARAAGARRFIVQSYCGWPFARTGGPIKTEEDPLDSHAPENFRTTLDAIRHVEKTVMDTKDIEAFALRYGAFYGPGTSISRDGSIVGLIKKRAFPIVGDGAGIWSFIHIEDAARATVAAVTQGAPGIYNIVDDDPAPVHTWLPVLASAVAAKPPRKIPVWVATLALGEGGVNMMTQIRGASNEKAKRQLGLQLRYPSWRRGFLEGL